MNYIFPAAFLSNTFAVTGLMIALGLTGNLVTAADFGIVHAATVALLHAFSANARSIILNPASPISTGAILGSRLMLLIPLGLLSLMLSMQLARVEPFLALVLVGRRCAEWIAEVHVSEMERARGMRQAARFFVLQAALFVLTAIWLIAGLPHAMPVLMLWATSPLWLSPRFIVKTTEITSVLAGDWRRLLPHFGSTAISGISVYVFRLLILLLVGKVAAGDFYTAFAIGGLLGSVFAQAIGPTLVLHEQPGAAPRLPRWIVATLVTATAVGMCLYFIVAGNPGLLDFSGKSGLFWQATGISLVGGAIMVMAQHFRLRMLQHHANNDVFGPDVLINILVVAAVPYIFYLLGSDALAHLYLLSAVTALLFYYSAGKNADSWSNARALTARIKPVIAVLLFLPLFFQLNGTLFRDPSYIFDTGGQLTRLPVPISVIACYGGLLLLGRYSRAQLALTTIFATFTLMLISSVLLAHVQEGQGQQAKLILLIQFVLPMFALVLGQLFFEEASDQSSLAACFLWILTVVVPLQLALTWSQGMLILSPDIGAFSIYQQLQYVPVIFVAGYLLALYTLWENPTYRLLLLVLAAPMGIYAGASVSALATAGLIAGAAGFAFHAWNRNSNNSPLAILAVTVLVASVGYFSIAAGKLGGKYDLIRLQTDTAMFAPKNLAERLAYWKFYSGEILESPKTAALGHATPPDRTKYPSAHNYYLDFAYNFGVAPLLPLLSLLGLTLIGVRRQWQAMRKSAPLLGLAVSVLFIVLVDNSFKVGMRQPYPGILTFFLWGLLLTQLFRRPSPNHNGRSA